MATLKDKIEFEIGEAEQAIKQTSGQFPRAFLLIIIGGILALVPTYIITKNISLNIWQKTYSQYLITAKPSFQNPKAIRIIKNYLVAAGAGSYAAAAEIKNENLDLALKNAAYAFNFYNANNQLIYSEKGTFFLLPNQKTYIVAPLVKANEEIKKAELFLPENLPWKKPYYIPEAKLLTSLPYVYNQSSPSGLAAEGVVENTSVYQLGQIRLVFLVFDGSGNVVGINQRSEFAILPNERRAYKQLWPNLNANLVSVQVFAEANSLDASNITAPRVKTNPSSDLSRPESNPRR